MNFFVEKVSEINRMTVHTITTNKYKTNTLVLLLKNQLDEKTVTKRALLPYVLQSGTERHPSRKLIREHLDDLYGANLSVNVQKKGEHHVISFRLEIANEKYLQNAPSLLNEGIRFLAELLLRPHVENGRFSKTIVESEKRALKQRIQAIHDDKIRYANVRLTEEMCQGEPFALMAYGKEEEIDAIDEESLYDYYQKIINEDEIHLYFVGANDAVTVEEYVNEAFQFPGTRSKNTSIEVIPVQKEVKEERQVFEDQEVLQGKLQIGFRTYTTYKDDDYYALQVFNGIFGGFSHSKLFTNVREKASLAYYVYSQYESHKGILAVASGIECSNFERAVKIIKKQWEAMKNGDFSDEEMEQTKTMIKNQLLETLDVPRTTIELLYHNVVAKKQRSIEEWIRGIEEVTREEIIQIANKIQLDTVYFLRGKEAGNNE